MRYGLIMVALVLQALAVMPVPAAAAQPVEPYEKSIVFAPAGRIDELVLKALTERGIAPAGLCSDEVFVRRVHLDVTGTLPRAEHVIAFVKDGRADKRARLIDDLLKSDAYVDYRTMKWCDLLRVKSEHPINLWPNGVQAYHQWIRHCVAANKPYDQFARDLLTSSGSNFREPAVNFYRAVQGQGPGALAAAAGLTFMGVRVEAWPADRRANLEVFFSRVAFKGTAEWKETIVHLDPAPSGALDAVLPDGRKVHIKPGDDPRKAFADWLITPVNPYFARNLANRTWAGLMGRGIIHEPDDIRDNNPPTNPALLAHLEQELVGARYDLKHLYRLILNSRTYQQSSIRRSDDPQARGLFAYYPVRQIEAEVLIDALVGLFGSPEQYESAIPEPFTFVPEYQRTIALADGSISSSFLELFGRPPRDTGLVSERSSEPTDAQRMHLLNSSHIQKKIDSSWRLERMRDEARGDRGKLVNSLYLSILSRRPTDAESASAKAYFDVAGVTLQQGTADLAWTLINSKEFLYRH
ncbi:MAG: DUF1553 domain-containing protein [Phycisphaeraceae bacterium]